MTNNKFTRKEFLKMTAGALGAGALMSSGLGRLAWAEGEMLKRPIPSTGEMIPAVGLGTALTFGSYIEGPEYDRRKNAVKALLDNGGTVIDTSPTYREAEIVVGKALDELGMRDKAFLATKISISGKAKGVAQNIQSQADLRTDHFELLQVHNLRDTTAHMETINKMREAGKVKYVGITHFRENRNDDLVQAMKDYPVDFIQCQYNMLDRSIEDSILPAALDNGVAIMINVPFARGRLFGAVKDQQIPEFTKEFGVDTWGKFFLKFILSHKAVTVVIPGTINDYHVIDNLGALKGRLPDNTEREKMAAFIQGL
jgi:aryl-alcohol dehydrogenase-like predicted oxidoreductase